MSTISLTTPLTARECGRVHAHALTRADCCSAGVNCFLLRSRLAMWQLTHRGSSSASCRPLYPRSSTRCSSGGSSGGGGIMLLTKLHCCKSHRTDQRSGAAPPNTGATSTIHPSAAVTTPSLTVVWCFSFDEYISRCNGPAAGASAADSVLSLHTSTAGSPSRCCTAGGVCCCHSCSAVSWRRYSGAHSAATSGTALHSRTAVCSSDWPSSFASTTSGSARCSRRHTRQYSSSHEWLILLCASVDRSSVGGGELRPASVHEPARFHEWSHPIFAQGV